MIPQGVIDVRNELCRKCVDKAGDPCAVCDHGRWGRYSEVGCDDPNRKVAGLGDVVSTVAQPIARTIDKIFKTNVAGCGGCKQRQEKLNRIFPLK